MARETQTERILEAIVEQMEQHAKTVLNGSEGTEFLFGRACGIHQGLGRALQAVRDVIEADERPLNR